ncbi:GNAT family N-acetyltransferase [Pedobacter sp.]|uniref:GNAT family N-acetyltransferase n=1 Tax=Pedobacter sp. TaxID=1411316 RepID=UPI0031CEBC45
MKADALDNPIWNSLTTTHQPYCLNLEGFRFYHPEYCPFGALGHEDFNTDVLLAYANLAHDFFIVGDRPTTHPKDLQLKNELVCNQMVLNNSISFDHKEEIVLLNGTYQQDLIALVNLVQPGYFKHKTPDLGNYYGIFKNDELVAVTGERMKMPQATEISAVVTHPEHSGKGYAKQLVAFVANQIVQEGKLPFLHVAEKNTGAIALYEKLGFVTRRKISFWNYGKAAI